MDKGKHREKETVQTVGQEKVATVQIRLLEVLLVTMQGPHQRFSFKACMGGQ